GCMSIGCLAGLAALKLWNALKVLRAAGFVSVAVLLAALYGPAGVSAAAFPLLGFTISVMFSIIMSTALNSVERYHGSLAGILCTGIAGGALGPLVVGWLGDMSSLRTGCSFSC
ncbi:MAG: MFS transporter, partial [Alistipes sp.]|nr:MFS transporter [Alistipes sp.]